MPVEQLFDVPRFSLAERDRRWAAVRKLMGEKEIDCLVAPNNTGHSMHFQAEARWLSHVGGGGDADVACVFPLKGEVAAVATSHQRWRHVQDWVTDLREARRAYGAGVVGKLKEVPIPHKRVGVVGLGDYIRAPEGIVLHGFMRALTEAFPDVEWVDFSNEMQSLRQVKSGEEIAFLARSSEIIDKGVEKVREIAKPGMIDYQVWGALIGELAMNGSEIPMHNHWGSGLNPHTLTRPSHGVLERGYLIVNEIEAAYGGYHAQQVQPFAIQECEPIKKDVQQMHADFWEKCFDGLKLGMTVREVQQMCFDNGAEMLSPGSKYEKPKGGFTMHGRGLGSDGPLVTGGEQADWDARVTPGWCFVFKPGFSVERAGRRYSAQWGDTVAITPDGPKRLGKRAPGLVITGL